MTKKYKKLKETKDYFKLLPIGLILAVVPMIVFMKVIKIDETFAIQHWRGQTSEYDFFSYYKMVWFISLTAISALFFFYYAAVKKITLDFPKVFIPLAAYLLLAFLSSSFSEFKEQAFFGFYERYEGFFTLLCYGLVCFITSKLITSEFDFKYLVFFLAISVTVMSLIGITQFLGFDLFQTVFGKKLILPLEKESLLSSLEFKFPEKYIYSTLYNPNYVGGFFAIVLPVSLIIFVSLRNILLKIISGIFCLLSFITLIGSLSTAGWVGAAAAGVAMLFFMRKSLKRNILPLFVILLCFGATALYMNQIAQGTIFGNLKISVNSVPSELGVNSPVLLNLGTPNAKVEILTADTTPQPSAPDYTNITDIKADTNKLILYTSETEALVISYDSNSGNIYFVDLNNTTVDMTSSEADNKNVLKFNDPRFQTIQITAQNNVLTVTAPNTTFYINSTKEGIKIITPSNALTDLAEAESFGFKGHELWGSSRGYIWSRSIPMLKDTILLGHGPDSYAIYFPQNDYASKLKYLNDIYLMVDKPHNLYLQIAINTGIVSLIAFLLFIGWYCIWSFRLYIKAAENKYFMPGVACLISVIAFLIVSLANDSTISVSLVLWILLGAGIGINGLYGMEAERISAAS